MLATVASIALPRRPVLRHGLVQRTCMTVSLPATQSLAANCPRMKAQVGLECWPKRRGQNPYPAQISNLLPKSANCRAPSTPRRECKTAQIPPAMPGLACIQAKTAAIPSQENVRAAATNMTRARPKLEVLSLKRRQFSQSVLLHFPG